MSKSTLSAEESSKPHNHVRTAVAAIFGFIAVVLLINVIAVFWLNRVITHTPTFVNTVAPLAEKPEIQAFVAHNGANALVESAPVEQLSSQLIGSSLPASLTGDQVKNEVLKVAETRIQTALANPEFARSWRQSLEQTHQYLVAQLSTDNDSLTLDLTPLAQQAVAQLKRSNIDQIVAEFEIPEKSASITVQRDEVAPLISAYNSLKPILISSIIGALVAGSLAVLISTHHIKTLRRVLILTGIFSLIVVALLHAPRLAAVSDLDPYAQAAAVAVADTVFSGLRSALVITAIISFLLAFGSKILEILLQKRQLKKQA